MRLYQNSGVSLFGFCVFAALIMAVVYSVFKLVPIGYNYLEIEGQMEAQARKANVFSDTEIQRTLLEQMKRQGIEPSDTSQLQINRLDGKITISYRYDEVFAIDIGDFYYEIYTFHLNPTVQAQLK
jgi:hypothetical protein